MSDPAWDSLFAARNLAEVFSDDEFCGAKAVFRWHDTDVADDEYVVCTRPPHPASSRHDSGDFEWDGIGPAQLKVKTS